MKLLSLFKNVLLSCFVCCFSIASYSDILEPAAAFTLPDLYTGEMVSLESYRGSVVLVDFWASWCGPCQASLPEYEALRKKLQANLPKNKFEILAINVDGSEEEAKQFLRKLQLNYPILKESSGKSQRDYELLAMPTSFLVDQKGFIRIAHVGFSPGYIDLLEKEVHKLLNEN